MSDPIPADAARLPYPHTRNDCEMCRERDADFHVLGEEYNHPGKRPLVLCQHCIGRHLVARVIANSGPDFDQPFTVSLAVWPERGPRRV